MLKNSSSTTINPLLYIPTSHLYGVTPRPTKNGVPVIGVNSRILVAKKEGMFTKLSPDTHLTIDFNKVPAEYWYQQLGSGKKYKVTSEILRTTSYNPTPNFISAI